MKVLPVRAVIIACLTAVMTAGAPCLASETKADREQLRKSLSEAQARLDSAASEVADLSRQLYGGQEADVVRFMRPGRRGAMLGVNIGSGGQEAVAGRVVRLGRARLPSRSEGRATRRQHQDADGEEGARRRDGIPADQPSARLPDLRSGRRMRPAGPGHGLRRRSFALRGQQAGGRGQVSRPARQDHHDAMHPLHALRPFRNRGRWCAGAWRDRARRGHGDHDLPRACDEVGNPGKRDRPLSGWCAPLRSPMPSRRGRGNSSRPS